MFICFISTGCLKRDTMEDILIYTSAYPIQYITEQLYGDNATIQSIYPNGIIIDKYTLTEKQLQDYSNCDLFIFNGLSVEKNYISPMLKSNRNLKIIDASASIEYTNRIEEMWLDPSNFLMTAQNIKIGFEEYVTNQYLLKQVYKTYIIYYY
jgi:ABC-type Zn uptake system ZnuABC Zn-binding protein ZnuA